MVKSLKTLVGHITDNRTQSSCQAGKVLSCTWLSGGSSFKNMIALADRSGELFKLVD